MWQWRQKKIYPTVLLSVPLVLKWSVLNSSHTKYCRLAGTQTVLGQGCVISSVCDTIEWMTPQEGGTPECKQHSRWIWPLLTQIGWTPYDRRGQQPWNIIAAAHRLSFCFPNEKPLSQQADLLHCCTSLRKEKRKYNDIIERRGSDLDLRPLCSRGTQNTISNINCGRLAECKHYSAAGCDIWANHLWVLDKISQMW